MPTSVVAVSIMVENVPYYSVVILKKIKHTGLLSNLAKTTGL